MNGYILKASIGFFASGLLVACSSTHTVYKPVSVTTPSAWANQETSVANVVHEEYWWRNFNDSQLNDLIELAIARNSDLAAATIRVRRAQLEAGLTQVNPTVALNLTTHNSRNLHGFPSKMENQSLDGTASYELDLWGKLESQRDAAQWEALATVQDRNSTLLALVGTTATLYWKISNQEQRLAISSQSIDYFEQLQKLMRLRHTAGAASELDVLEADRALASQQARHVQLQQESAETRAALALLFDAPPEIRYVQPKSLSAIALPPIDAGLPSQLLRRRPDLAAAELRLRKQLADNDALRASYYPSLTLTGALGSSSRELLNLVKNPVGVLGSSLAFPFVQWNQMQLSVKVSKADYEQAAINFRQVFYKALSDVEVALSARQHFQEQGKKLNQTVVAAKHIEYLYGQRYRNGAVPLKDWLDAQENLRADEIALANNNVALLISQVKLYQALGGDSDGRTDD